MSLKKDEISSSLDNGKYVLALSGGVDSVVLLDILAEADIDVVLAHLDHGIREESDWDERFCRQLSLIYGLEYRSKQLKLGADASENTARKERYAFLEAVAAETNAKSIITAHHQDDLIETALHNIIRGTGWRGLVSISTNKNIIRPLLSVSKAEIYEYACTNQLEWLEDPTNNEDKYTRNIIRNKLIPLLSKEDKNFAKKFLTLLRNTEAIGSEILELTERILSELEHNNALDRNLFIRLPAIVRRELIYFLMKSHDANMSRIGQAEIKKIEHFFCTAKPNKILQPNKDVEFQAKKHKILYTFN